MSRCFICGPAVYEYKGWTFEYGWMTGPWPLKKNGEPMKRRGRKFLKDIACFSHLDEETKKLFRAGGGCTAF